MRRETADYRADCVTAYGDKNTWTQIKLSIPMRP